MGYNQVSCTHNISQKTYQDVKICHCAIKEKKKN